MKCRHCGKRIVHVNYSLGARWVHQHPDESFLDGLHEYCHITHAEPEQEAPYDTYSPDEYLHKENP